MLVALPRGAAAQDDPTKPVPLSVAFPTGGNSGISTLGHLASGMFASATGAKYVDVPFTGGGPAIIDTLAGHSQMMLGTIVQGIGPIKSGRLMVLAHFLVRETVKSEMVVKGTAMKAE